MGSIKKQRKVSCPTDRMAPSAYTTPSADDAAKDLRNSQVFKVVEPTWDLRDFVPSLLLLLEASSFPRVIHPLRQHLYCPLWPVLGLPPLIRLRWPTFDEATIVDDLHIKAGASLSLAGLVTALILQLIELHSFYTATDDVEYQNHHPSISLAMKMHSDFSLRALFLYVELALNGSSEEREKIASWLRWMHRNIHGSVTPKGRKQLGLPNGIDYYGYLDDLKAYVMETLTWSTLTFQERFGKCLSPRARDAIVLEYACASMRPWVPRSLLTSNYDDFLASFNRRLDVLDAECDLNSIIIRGIEASMIDLRKKRWITSIVFRAALMVGFSLLPTRVHARYQLTVLKSRRARFVQRNVCALLWAVYPFLVWIPLRGLICLFLIVEPQLRTVLRSSLQTIHLLRDQPVPPQSGATRAPVYVPSYLAWLAGGQGHPPFPQKVLVRTLEVQLQCPSWTGDIRAWISYRLSDQDTLE
ncbi:hypothetical protein B0H11DRAFT_2182634 [Mycena galericulata]|nr:hypothetical protein B0H11DRAFT_2182634 [Mycena galericulata]